MREILFRGFHPDRRGSKTISLNGEKIKGEWVQGLLPYANKIRVFTTQEWFDEGEIREYATNGNKIFKGDIVEYSDEECFYPEEYTTFIGRIVFECGAYGIGADKEIPLTLENGCNNDNFVSLWELYWNLNCTQNELPMLEVIGNIFENPELLEVEK